MMKLYENEIVRIRDVYIKFYETLEAEDQVIQKMFGIRLFLDKPFTTAEFCNFNGKDRVKRNQNILKGVSLQLHMNMMFQYTFPQ